MNNDFVAEILRATGSLRSGDPAGVTAIIQNALAAAGLTTSTGARAQGSPISSFHLPQILLRPTATQIEGTVATDGPEPHDPHWSRDLLPEGSAEPSTAEVLGRGGPDPGAGRKGLGLEGMMPGLGVPVRAPDLPMPEGAEFRDLQHSCAAGGRRYRLYVPASAADGLQGLIVMLHGCTQNPEDFAAGTGMNALAEEHRLLIAYPAQTGGDNIMSCWNWFRPGDQLRDTGEPAIIAGLTESIRADFAIPRDRVFIAGLSAGGAMAAIMAETYPETYAAIGIHSGLAYGSANDVMSAFSAMGGQAGIGERPFRLGDASPDAAPRVIVFHGSADTTVHPVNADRIIASQGGEPARTARSEHAPSGEIRGYTRTVVERDDGTRGLECWMVDGARHAWSGGHPSGSYTDPRGPNASAEMVRFFLDGAPAGD